MPEKNHKYENPLDNDNTLQFLSGNKDHTEIDKNNNIIKDTKQKQPPIHDRQKTDKNGRELKRKRYNLLLVPSLYKDIEKIAYVLKTSANEVINRALMFYKEKEKETLDKYTEIEKLRASER